MLSSWPFRPMFVFLQVIDNVKIAEVITTFSLQKIKIVYSGLVKLKMSLVLRFYS